MDEGTIPPGNLDKRFLLRKIIGIKGFPQEARGL
jgi:hypothetical protein